VGGLFSAIAPLLGILDKVYSYRGAFITLTSVMMPTDINQKEKVGKRKRINLNLPSIASKSYSQTFRCRVHAVASLYVAVFAPADSRVNLSMVIGSLRKRCK